MANRDALKQRGVPRPFSPTIKSHLAYTLLCALVIMLMLSLVRLGLLLYNSDMIGDTPPATVAEGFFNGLRFDLRVVVYLSIPLLLAVLSPWAMARRGFFRLWLTLAASTVMFLGLVEMDFYREFHQRLNGLVFQYIKEDPKTVMSMLWYGFPVVRYLLAWIFGTWLLSLLFKGIDRLTRGENAPAVPWYNRLAVFMVILLVAVVAARGTLRQGPPMRWGDAFTTDSNFINQLGLNGTLTLIDAAHSRFGEDRSKVWKATLDPVVAQQSVRDLLLTPSDRLVDADSAAIRRDFTPPADRTLPIKNVVVILMESFAGHSVGALGSQNNITPYFDKLAKEGLLFDRFFSNGTHTHQGMFATMACFPNLP
ncbi:MAG: rane protein, partial [Pseudomonas sp.]|nr:rane protein [Pseudomonas sp.]